MMKSKRPRQYEDKSKAVIISQRPRRYEDKSEAMMKS
jgi:hypothetical protein